MSTALVIDASLPRNRKPQVHAAILLAKNQDTDDFTTAIPMTAGSGAPSHNAAVTNELYIRTDASDSDLLLYRAVNTSGTWEAVVGSEVTDLLAATNAWTGANTFSHASGVTTDTLTERTSAAGVTIDGLLIKDGAIVADKFVVATIAVANATGGATTASLTLDLTRSDGTVLTAAVQVFIDGVTTQYYTDGSRGACTFGSATKGAIVASGAGWALVTTDADGEFDCTVTNASDETVYFSVRPAPGGYQTAGSGVFSVLSNSDAATWSA